MPWFGKRTIRQKEIRRSKAERSPAWWRRLAEHVDPGPVSVVLFAGLVGAWIVNLGDDSLQLHVGQNLARALTARVQFRIADADQTAAMRTRAQDNAPNYYALDESLLQDIENRLTNALRIAREQASDPPQLREQAARINIALDDAALAELQRIAGLEDARLYTQAVERAIQTLRRQPLVEAVDRAQRRTSEKAVLQDPGVGTEREVEILKLIYANDREGVQRVVDAAASEFPEPLRVSLATSLRQMLAVPEQDRFRPLYRYDATRSALAAQQAAAAVPTQYDEFAVGDRLADAGPLTREELDLLREEHAQQLAWQAADPAASRARQLADLGRSALTFIAVVGLGIYVIANFQKYLGSFRRRFTTVLVLAACLLLARLAYIQNATPFLATGLQAFAVALLAITATRGVAHVTSGLMALLLALATRQSMGFVLTLGAVTLVVLLGLRDLRHRGRIITVGFLAALTAGLLTLLTGLVGGQSAWFVITTHALWAMSVTLTAAFIIEGLLPTIEWFIGVTTNMTLLEWCDPNKPLLRMLAAESPGTYNHSLLVGTLADAASEAIGANGLLARTGAYYHDIGKISKPEYFVENQALGMVNRHERLSPAMSHLIIIGHVKDGVEMAKEYKLPSRLHPFIPEHHGTCVIEYFYRAATLARKPGDPEIPESEFRYPGPKPQSRETAIVMICDAIEGAVRAMPEPTPNRIEDTVARMIQKRLMDGQFDECDLTFRELAIIQRSLVKSLNSIYHGRIAYPSDEKPATRSAS